MKNKTNIVQRVVREYSDVFKEIYAEYATRTGYHGIKHIESMMKEYADITERGITTARVEDVFAIAIHDYVYDADSKTNEHESACVAGLIMTNCGFAQSKIDRAIKIIEATANHEFTGDESVDIILDIDQLYLGSVYSESYWTATRNIKKEYMEIYTEEQWLLGRREFLISRQDRDRIFLSDHYCDQNEFYARRNIGKELNRIYHELEELGTQRIAD